MSDARVCKRKCGDKMNPNPLRTASHIGLWLCVVLIGIWLVWSATHNTSNKYYADSKPTDIKHDGFRLVDRIDLFNFSCARGGLKDAISSNSKTNSNR